MAISILRPFDPSTLRPFDCAQDAQDAQDTQDAHGAQGRP
jgi:hypothetical protein